MKRALIFALVSFTTAAHADFKVEPIVSRLNDVAYECSAGENHDGEKISREKQQSACREETDLKAFLAENHMCLVNFEWVSCK